jgi:nucleotide-binding universal stress UspA family protein
MVEFCAIDAHVYTLQVKHTCELALGDPRGHICDFVEDKKCNLLIMGSRGMGAIKRYVLSSRFVSFINRMLSHVCGTFLLSFSSKF